MKTWFLIALALLCATGCVQISPEQRKTLAAPLGSVPELIKAATLFRLAESRWPETKAEFEAGFSRWKEAPEFLSEIQTVSIVEQSSRTILYRFGFSGGGTSEIRVNLNIDAKVSEDSLRLAMAEPVESARVWANDFFAEQAKIENAAMESVLAAHPDWEQRLVLYRDFARAQSDLFHYLFVYHAERGGVKLEWHDGDGTFGIFVCNCGKEGSVPTEEFERLFQARAAAIDRFTAVYDEKALGDLYRECKRVALNRSAEELKPLKERFDRLQKEQLPSLKPELGSTRDASQSLAI